MASIEKSRKGKKGKTTSAKSLQQKKHVGGIPAIEEPDAVREERLATGHTAAADDEGAVNIPQPGSVISVRDAHDTAKTDNQENNGSEPEHTNVVQRPPSGRPKSSKPPEEPSPPPSAVAAPSSRPSSRPSSAASQRPGSATVHPTTTTGPAPVPTTIPDFTADGSRPPSAASRAFMPPANEENKRPSSATKSGKKRSVEPLALGSGQMGSAVSLQSRTSREVWVNDDEKVEPPKTGEDTSSRPASAAQRSRPPSAAQSIVSVGQASTSNRLETVKPAPVEIIPPDMNEAHAYVPYLYARDCIAKMMEDMKHMKRKHITIVNDIEENYQHIEKETQNQFNTFVLTLRQQYGVKVKTFRQVIEVHRAELASKAQYWDEALTSMSNKNKELLNDKKGLLIQNKIEFDRLTKEKDAALENTLSASAQKDGELEKLRKENKVLADQLESEKDEVERQKIEIDELKNRPKTAQSEKLVLAAPSDSGQGQVVVTDMSQADRERMDEERRQMERERADMKRERARLEKEREDFTSERTRFTEEIVTLQGTVNTARGEKEVWRVKHDSLRAQLGQHDDWRRRYEVLLAQYEAVTEVAEVNTEQEKQKTEAKISSCTADKLMMEEEKQRLDKEVKQYENAFRKQHGKAPTEQDRSDSAEESYNSLEEATHMLNKLTAQIAALEALKRGDIPPPPTVEKEVIEIKETEVKTVEIKVPDPELLAHIEMTQAEMDALKQQLSVLKNDKSDLASEKSKLQQQISDQAAHITQLNAALEAMQSGEKVEKPTPVITPVESTPVAAAVAPSGDNEELQKQIRELSKGLRDAELAHKDALREADKEKRSVEKDLKQALRALAKAEKGSSREERRLKDLLAIVAAQVREINGKVNKAAAEVDTRLASAETQCKATKERQNLAKQKYDSWEIGWAEENEREPGVADVDNDSEGSALHKALSSANKDMEKDDMLVEALTLIKTGAVPEVKKEEVAMEKASPALKAAQARPGPDLTAVNENDEEVARLEAALDQAEDKIQELQYKCSDLQTDNTHLQADKQSLENDNRKLEDRVKQLRRELELERERIQQSVRPLSSTSPIPMLASTPDALGGIDLEDYTRQIHTLQEQVDASEQKLRDEKHAHEATKQELENLQSQLNALKVELENEKSESQAKQDAVAHKKDAEIANLNKKLEEMRSRLQALEQERLKALPPDTQKEITALNKRLAEKERECDTKETEKAELSAKVRELVAKIKSLENTSKNAKSSGHDAEIKLKAVKQERDREIKRIQGEADKKERERALQEQKKISALEQKIRELEYAHTPGGAAKIATTKANVAKGDNKVLEDRLREAKRENNDLNARLKQMEKELKTASKGAGGGVSDIAMKKQEKLAQELMKKLDDMTERKKKLEETVHARDGDIKALEKDIKKKDTEIERLKAELAQLGVAAKAAVDSEAKRKEMEKELKTLREENKTLNDNYNSERVLRKKYYNMVEDMKGKIRVYTRVRPMSGSELERGNHNVVRSPDEYTVQIETGRGMKEWQFDQIFMPDSAQEKVFEDTNNLIQSAVDGYNVCIFAYGQTGSGKTFTIIGDREQKYPGIAPRAFNRIFQLLEENKSKFSYSVSCYMLELYNDKLLDLFAKAGGSHDDKLEIKKDKKGMVVVVGSEIKAARNPKELFALFDEGTANRHTASTKMNAESSRSHLVIGIIIETTNKTTGSVLRGKLSLVDLAGSERAAKTGAGAEQLKEAMSINKSLSALGDVISALSSEQSFIPYRNNKLTMLMQDSLGGNAKTLMFVNISPADYNAEESAISLTYASRVKLITNDAQKNADNKEINRLKAVIAKMKSGQSVEEELD